MKSTPTWRNSMNSPKEKARRREQMIHLNKTFKRDKPCEFCKQTFKAGIGAKYCTSFCKNESSLFSRYGITSADVTRMKHDQHDKCAICDIVRPLVIDHCHKTGKVRGLLCRTCNMLLHYIDDESTRERIEKYVSSKLIFTDN